nr:hypothetical protein [uncultured Flavobacterium sp.]
MKKIIPLIIILFSFISQGQNKFTKVEKGKCKINHSCNLEYYYDNFQDIKKFKIGFYETNLAKISAGNGNSLTYTLDKATDKNKKQITFISLFGSKKGCRNKDSYVHFIMSNGEKFKVETMIKSIDCGTSFISVELTNEIMSILLKNEISKIRLQYLDNSEDFEINEKGQKKLFKNLECITNAT